MSSPIPCPECDGTGKCLRCSGQGVLWQFYSSNRFGEAMGWERDLSCDWCKRRAGTTNSPGRCPCCGGTGVCYD